MSRPPNLDIEVFNNADGALTTGRTNMDQPASPISSRVVDAVCSAKDVGLTALPPLYETIDPDALDALFAAHTSERSTAKQTLVVQFFYAGYEVTVRSPDDVDVREINKQGG